MEDAANVTSSVMPVGVAAAVGTLTAVGIGGTLAALGFKVCGRVTVPGTWTAAAILLDLSHVALATGLILSLAHSASDSASMCSAAAFFLLAAVIDVVGVLLINGIILLFLQNPARLSELPRHYKGIMLLMVAPQKILTVTLSFLPLTPLGIFDTSSPFPVQCFPLRQAGEKGGVYAAVVVFLVWATLAVAVTLCIVGILKLWKSSNRRIHASAPNIWELEVIGKGKTYHKMLLLEELVWVVVVFFTTLVLYSNAEGQITPQWMVLIALGAEAAIHTLFTCLQTALWADGCCRKRAAVKEPYQKLKKLELIRVEAPGRVRMRATWSLGRGVVKRGLLRVYSEGQLKAWAQEIVVLGMLRKLQSPSLLSCLWTCSHNPYHETITLISGQILTADSRLTCLEMTNCGSLREFLHGLDSPIPETCQRSILHDIAEGLSALHGQNVLHRNLSSQAVYLKGSMQCLVLRAAIGDFEEAQIYGSLQNGSAFSQAAPVSKKQFFLPDIRAFALVALEILSFVCRRRAENKPVMENPIPPSVRRRWSEEEVTGGVHVPGSAEEHFIPEGFKQWEREIDRHPVQGGFRVQEPAVVVGRQVNSADIPGRNRPTSPDSHSRVTSPDGRPRVGEGQTRARSPPPYRVKPSLPPKPAFKPPLSPPKARHNKPRAPPPPSDAPSLPPPDFLPHGTRLVTTSPPPPSSRPLSPQTRVGKDSPDPWAGADDTDPRPRVGEGADPRSQGRDFSLRREDVEWANFRAKTQESRDYEEIEEIAEEISREDANSNWMLRKRKPADQRSADPPAEDYWGTGNYGKLEVAAYSGHGQPTIQQQRPQSGTLGGQSQKTNGQIRTVQMAEPQRRTVHASLGAPPDAQGDSLPGAADDNVSYAANDAIRELFLAREQARNAELLHLYEERVRQGKLGGTESDFIMLLKLSQGSEPSELLDRASHSHGNGQVIPPWEQPRPHTAQAGSRGGQQKPETVQTGSRPGSSNSHRVTPGGARPSTTATPSRRQRPRPATAMLTSPTPETAAKRTRARSAMKRALAGGQAGRLEQEGRGRSAAHVELKYAAVRRINAEPIPENQATSSHDPQAPHDPGQQGEGVRQEGGGARTAHESGPHRHGGQSQDGGREERAYCPRGTVGHFSSFSSNDSLRSFYRQHPRPADVSLTSGELTSLSSQADNSDQGGQVSDYTPGEHGEEGGQTERTGVRLPDSGFDTGSMTSDVSVVEPAPSCSCSCPTDSSETCSCSQCAPRSQTLTSPSNSQDQSDWSRSRDHGSWTATDSFSSYDSSRPGQQWQQGEEGAGAGSDVLGPDEQYPSLPRHRTPRVALAPVGDPDHAHGAPRSHRVKDGRHLAPPVAGVRRHTATKRYQELTRRGVPLRVSVIAANPGAPGSVTDGDSALESTAEVIEEEEDLDEHASSFCSESESHAYCESCHESGANFRAQPRPLQGGPAPPSPLPAPTLAEIPEDAASQTSGDETRAFLPKSDPGPGMQPGAAFHPRPGAPGVFLGQPAPGTKDSGPTSVSSPGPRPSTHTELTRLAEAESVIDRIFSTRDGMGPTRSDLLLGLDESTLRKLAELPEEEVAADPNVPEVNLLNGMDSRHVRYCRDLSAKMPMLDFDELLPAHAESFVQLRAKLEEVGRFGSIGNQLLDVVQACWLNDAPPSTSELALQLVDSVTETEL